MKVWEENRHQVERIFLILSINKTVRASIKTNIKPFNATYNREEEENIFY